MITVSLIPRYGYKLVTLLKEEKVKDQYRSGSPWYSSPERTLIALFFD